MRTAYIMKWLLIVCYMALLFWMWWSHVPVRNILLFFLIYTVMTCLMLILLRLIREKDLER